MMELKLYQIDAFADKVFSGNSAAVCPLESWLDDSLMQKIAMENNLAETAFYTKQDDGYQIRWFTPTIEVDLCGHATLATAFVLFTFEGHTGDTILFHSPRSGRLNVAKRDNLLVLDFPSDVYEQVALSEALAASVDIRPIGAMKGKTDYMLLFEHESQIRNVKPNLSQIATLDARGLIITAKGDQVDFVSHFFAPQSGVDEDPVTGSAHTTLTPYWSEQLGKDELTALQLSARTGYLQCKYRGERVEIAGYAQLYLKGTIYVE